MSDISKMISQLVENSVFCVDKDGGEGYVEKANCSCYNAGEKCCQAYYDKEQFHKYFKEAIGFDLEVGNYNDYMKQVSKVRKGVIEKAEKELNDSKWFKDNVR